MQAHAELAEVSGHSGVMNVPTGLQGQHHFETGHFVSDDPGE